MGYKPRNIYDILNLKAIIPLIIISLIFSSQYAFFMDAAEGAGFPGYTISGLVRNNEGVAIKNASVSVENMRTGDIEITATDMIGRYIVDISNYPSGYLVGDMILSSAFKNGFGGNNTGLVLSSGSGSIINITIEDVLVPEFHDLDCIGDRSDELIIFSVNVSDNIEVTGVDVFYLTPSMSDFSPMAMVLNSGNSSNGVWSAQIPDVEVTGLMYYYFSAMDSSSNINATSIMSKEILHGNSHSFSIFLPASTVAGEEFSMIVNVLDKYGNQVTDYSQEIVLKTTDPYYPDGEIGSYTFSISDNGSHVFDLVQLFKAGPQWLEAEEKDNASMNGASMILVISSIPDAIVLVPDNSTITAGDPQPYVLILHDEYANPTFANMDYEFSLSSESATGTFSSGSTITISSGEAQAIFYYSDTTASPSSTMSITAYNSILGSCNASIRVISSNGSHWAITPDHYTSPAGEMILLTIQLIDQFGNQANVNTTTDIQLMTSSETGIFLTNDSVVRTLSITPEDDAIYCYYLDNVSHNAPTVIRMNNGTFYGDGLSIFNISSAIVTDIQLKAEFDTYIAGQDFDLSIYAFDIFGNLATPSGYTFMVMSTDEQALNKTVSSTGTPIEVFEYALFTSGPQKISVKVLDEDISSNITLNILSNVMDKLKISTMGHVDAGEPFSCVVSILDGFDNTVMNYSGDVEFFSDDTYPAVLPPPYTYSVQDKGSHLFKDSFILYITPSKNLTAMALNENISITQEITILDNSRPSAFFDHGAYPEINMDKMIFNLQVFDNIQIEEVKMYYSFDDLTYSCVNMSQVSGNYSTGIGNYSTEFSISTTGDLHVYFSVSDGSNIVDVYGPQDMPYMFNVAHDDYELLVYIIVFVLLASIIASVVIFSIQKGLKP